MILDFLDFLSQSSIEYRFTNGYECIFSNVEDNSDFDILFKKSDFGRINSIIKKFCNNSNYQIVQIYHHDLLAKNFFLYNDQTHELLNLDLYGELSKQHIRILDEFETFNSKLNYNGISILKSHQEFIQYFIKKIDKQSMSRLTFDYLVILYRKDKRQCDDYLKMFFAERCEEIIHVFTYGNFETLKVLLDDLRTDFLNSKNTSTQNWLKNKFRILKRIVKPTGISIAFLGPDGAGKSTIIDGILNQRLPFRRHDYFHLKPLFQNNQIKNTIVHNPHQSAPYSTYKSALKLLYFIFQYNIGWYRNVLPLRIKSSLVVFDRYYDDMQVDYKRYRYGGGRQLAKLVGTLIPKPEIYFILTAEAAIIQRRKQEVPFIELERQIKGYQDLADGRRYICINVNRAPDAIILDITKLLMKKMHERY